MLHYVLSRPRLAPAQRGFSYSQAIAPIVLLPRSGLVQYLFRDVTLARELSCARPARIQLGDSFCLDPRRFDEDFSFLWPNFNNRGFARLRVQRQC
jgi:hypothetical protein